MARKPALDEDQQKELKCIVEQEIGLHRSFKNNHEEWNETKSPAPKIHTTKELGKLYNTSERTTGGYITKLFENDKDLLKERTHYVRCQTKSGENHPMYGKTHSEETKRKMSGENHPMYGKTGENNPMYGKTHSEESKIKMSGAKSGENNYWYGKTHSEETKIKMSGENHYWYGKTGENHPMYGKTGENHPMYGKTHSEESKIKMSGAKIEENHPNWNGGTSFLPYSPSFEKVMKPLIRARDDYNCQFCDIQENGKAHAVHHIDHDKNNDLEQNLILLCQPCHNTETSSNKNTEIKREEWIKWSQSKINDIYQSMTKEKKNELQQVKNDLENKLGLQK